MSKRKGVSAEEKRTRMLQLFYEKKDFFQLKELEKIAPKEKGIIVQSVKDVIQSLVDDGLVDTDKIGTSVYFWAYPSKAKHSRKRKLEEMKKQLDQMDKKLKISKEEFNSYQTNDEEEMKKAEILTEIAELRAKKLSLIEEIQMHKDHDPEVFETIKKNIKATKEAANRWTDNIFAVKDWCKKKYSIDEGTLNKQFGISPELDYIS